MKKRPNVTQKLILKYKDRILMFRRKNGAYDFPGGRLEFLESPLSALKRELKEELNFDLKSEPRPFYVWNYVSKDKKRHSIMLYYRHRLKKKENFASPEGMKILWLRKREMNKIILDKSFVDRIYE
ncbi:NUDIX hydrolase [Patescibacteria group bacterium]|nr:NUDIX hydrolase [Patescibacteria group bacterium]